jgi:hypothetical protein
LAEGIGAFFQLGLTIVMPGGRRRRCFLFDGDATTASTENANAYDKSIPQDTCRLRSVIRWNVTDLFLLNACER